MIALMLTAIMVDRPAFTLRNVALAATLILILQPESLMQAGFQMSFAACTALVAAYEAKRHWQAQRYAQGKGLKKFDPRNFNSGWRNMSGRASRYIGGLSLTSLLAGLSTAPFAAYHFNQFANYVLVANLLAVPAMAFIIMPMGVMALLMMPFGLDGPFLSLMGLGIDHVMSVAFEISTWPRAVNQVSSWPPMALAFIVFGGLWLCLRKTPRRVAGVAATLIGFALGLQARPPDLVIDRDAGNIAVLASDGDLVVMSKRARYAADSWSRRSGQGRTYEPPDRSSNAIFSAAFMKRWDGPSLPMSATAGPLKMSVMKPIF